MSGIKKKRIRITKAEMEKQRDIILMAKKNASKNKTAG